jgi:hypothetical protein
MNWRNTSNNQDHFYDHPNTALFPNFTAWFELLESENLRTYFNDHPYPVAAQTSAQEVAFRWNGLTEWLARGLTYWCANVWQRGDRLLYSEMIPFPRSSKLRSHMFL